MFSFFSKCLSQILQQWSKNDKCGRHRDMCLFYPLESLKQGSGRT